MTRDQQRQAAQDNRIAKLYQDLTALNERLDQMTAEHTTPLDLLPGRIAA